MNLDSWYSLFGWVSVCAAVLTVCAAVGTLVVGRRISRRDSARLAAASHVADSTAARVEQIEGSLEDRHLSPDQRAALIARLKPFAHAQLRVFEYDLSREANAFSREIQAAALEAGWDVKVIGAMGGADLEPGVLVLIRKDQKTVPAAWVLSEALRSIGVRDVKYRWNDGFSPPQLMPAKDVVQLFVGPKR